MRSGGLNLLDDGPEIVAAYNRACFERLQRAIDLALVFDSPDAVERVEQRADDRRPVDVALAKGAIHNLYCGSGNVLPVRVDDPVLDGEQGLVRVLAAVGVVGRVVVTPTDL